MKNEDSEGIRVGLQKMIVFHWPKVDIVSAIVRSTG